MEKQNSIVNRFYNLRDQLNSFLKNKEQKKEPVRVLVTGACGNIGYALCFMIAQGRMFGNDRPVILHLFEIPPMKGAVNGLKMELFDGAFPLVKGIVASVEPEVAFKDIDYAVFVGARPRSKGMERKDLLSLNGKIFEEQGKYLEQYANRNVKSLVVGNPANTNCLVLMKNAPSINPKNFTALTRLDQNRMISQLAEKMNIVDCERLKNCIVWGNHSATQFPHTDYSVVDVDGVSIPLNALLNDNNWRQGEFISKVQKRGAAIIEARGLSSAASAASAACDHINDWVNGTEKDNWVSMAVVSNGEYGAEKNTIFSFPCTCVNGEWSIVQGLKLDEFAKEKIAKTSEELRQERKFALNI